MQTFLQVYSAISSMVWEEKFQISPSLWSQNTDSPGLAVMQTYTWKSTQGLGGEKRGLLQGFEIKVMDILCKPGQQNLS